MDDDDGYKPDPNINALEKSKKVSEINFNCFVFMEDPNFEYVDIHDDDLFEPEFLKLCERNVFFIHYN